MADGEPEPQSGEAGRLRERVERNDVVERERGGDHGLTVERGIELVDDDERLGRRAGELHNRVRREQRARRIVRVADEEDARGRRELLLDRRQRVREVVLVRHLVDHHALLSRAGLVVPERRDRGEKRGAALAVGVEDRVDRRVDAVEGLDVLCRHVKHCRQCLVQPGVLGIGRIRFGRKAADRLDHPGARPDRALVEVETQERAPALERRRVWRQGFDFWFCLDHRRAGQRFRTSPATTSTPAASGSGDAPACRSRAPDSGTA